MEEEVEDPLKKRITTAENSREIVWKNVISEIRHSVFTWGNFFTVLIVGFLPSLFDFGTDYLQAVKFLWGSNYTKHVVNKTDFGNCSHIGRYTSFAGPTPEIVYEEIECFEVDKIWGCATLAIILLPGFCLARWTFLQARNHGCRMLTSLGILAFFVISVPIFPLLVILLKVMAMTRPGPEIEKICDEMVSIEGVWESTLQLLLNLFIVFTRADRSPSTVQIASMFASLVLIVKTAITDFTRGKLPKEATLDDRMCQMLPLLPLFLFNTIFKLGSIAIVASLLRYWTFLFFPGLPLVVALILTCAKRFELRAGYIHHSLGLVKVERIVTFSCTGSVGMTEKSSLENLLFHNIIWFLVNSTTLFCIMMAANYNYLDDMTDYVIFLKDIKQLNCLVAVVLVSGVASSALVFIQLWRPYYRENYKNYETGENSIQ